LDHSKKNKGRRIGLFIISIAILCGFLYGATQGLIPSDLEIISHNIDTHVDATTLVYQEIEHMAKLEENVKEETIELIQKEKAAEK